jgi:hypothetical protein
MSLRNTRFANHQWSGGEQCSGIPVSDASDEGLDSVCVKCCFMVQRFFPKLGFLRIFLYARVINLAKRSADSKDSIHLPVLFLKDSTCESHVDEAKGVRSYPG